MPIDVYKNKRQTCLLLCPFTIGMYQSIEQAIISIIEYLVTSMIFLPLLYQSAPADRSPVTVAHRFYSWVKLLITFLPECWALNESQPLCMKLSGWYQIYVNMYYESSSIFSNQGLKPKFLKGNQTITVSYKDCGGL